MGGRYGFCSPCFCLICTVFYSFSQRLLVPHWSWSLTVQPAPVCVCRVVIVVRGWASGSSPPCGSAAGYTVTSEHTGRGRVGKSEQHLKWQLSRWFILCSWSSIFVHQIIVLCFLSISTSFHRSFIENMKHISVLREQWPAALVWQLETFYPFSLCYSLFFFLSLFISLFSMWKQIHKGVHLVMCFYSIWYCGSPVNFWSWGQL